MKRVLAGLFAALLVLSIAPGTVLGFTGTLDQENLPVLPVDGSTATAAPGYIGQTFTAGATGYLTEVQIYAAGVPGANQVGPNVPDSTLTARIMATSSGLPTGDALATAVFTSASGFTWVTLPFATPAHLTSGTIYALVMQMTGNMSAAVGQSYAGGRRFSSADGISASLAPDDWDFAFRTYVAATLGTPPPTSTGATGSGSGSGLPLILIVGAFAGVGIGALVLRRHEARVR